MPVPVKAGEGEKPSAPDVGALRINAKLNGSFDDVERALLPVEKGEVAKTKEGVSFAYVETKDLNGIPVLFFIINFKKDGMDILYSIPQNTTPSKRKWEVTKKLLSIIMLLRDIYSIDTKDIVGLVDMVIKDLDAYATQDYSRLYSEYDKLRNEIKRLNRRIVVLSEENERLVRENYELNSKNDELILKIKKLETLSPETLRERIQDWLREHNGEINIGEFARVYSVPEALVEEQLNKLVKEGFITPIQ
jgi:DNA-binding transcriptional ArsR family regulator